MDLGKKGIIFSLLAIGFSGLFILLFSNSLERPIDEGINIANTRVHDLDNSINTFYAYATDSLDTAGFAAIEALYDQIEASSTFLGSSNFENDLLTCLNDSTGCTSTVTLTTLLDGYKELLANATRTELNYTVNSLAVTDEQHWLIEVTANISVSVADDYASWRLDKTVKKTISTVGARDPTYLAINNLYGGTEERRIIPNERQDYVEWDLPAFVEFFKGREYHPSLSGPCLSDRYEGGFTQQSSRCGLESIVDPSQHPTLLGPAYDSLTHMDYQVLDEANNRYPCDDLSGGMPRVSIRAVNKMLTLTRQDATRYKLNDENIWYYVPAIASTTARGCPDFV